MTMRLPYQSVVDGTTDGKKTLNGDSIDGNFDALALATKVNALEIVAGGGLGVVAMGTGTWVWPGAALKSNATVITHGLGTTPLVVITFPNQFLLAADTIASEAYTYTATQFSTKAQFVGGFVPGVGGQATFVWIALG